MNYKTECQKLIKQIISLRVSPYKLINCGHFRLMFEFHTIDMFAMDRNNECCRINYYVSDEDFHYVEFWFNKGAGG